jgi:hypothetical protein
VVRPSFSEEKEAKRLFYSGPGALASSQPMPPNKRSFLVLFFKKELLAFNAFALRLVTPYVTSPPIAAGRRLCG